ncbi:MAG TPA: hypothetical protein VIS73_10340 [Rhodocyclaceae bacterium]
MRYLANESRDPRLDEVVMALCAEMLVASGLESARDAARSRADAALTSGKAAEVFERMVVGLGGPPDFVTGHEQHLPVASLQRAVYPDTSGFLSTVDAFRLGQAVIGLGGGRRKLGDTLNLAVGLAEVAPIGARVDHERPLAVVHANSVPAAKKAAALVLEACEISDSEPATGDVIHDLLN